MKIPLHSFIAIKPIPLSPLWPINPHSHQSCLENRTEREQTQFVEISHSPKNGWMMMEVVRVRRRRCSSWRDREDRPTITTLPRSSFISHLPLPRGLVFVEQAKLKVLLLLEQNSKSKRKKSHFHRDHSCAQNMASQSTKRRDFGKMLQGRERKFSEQNRSGCWSSCWLGMNSSNSSVNSELVHSRWKCAGMKGLSLFSGKVHCSCIVVLLRS